ncbi:PP2C family protein-serine/threonine phosphatase [Streptomyces sp. NPDC088400]|uniref:PP2C family protein-serine/threonine phosphatase n=1 Tax=Streptomyces sp. NPDC088400 TaxID=3365861 RepID=UPI00380B0CB6
MASRADERAEPADLRRAADRRTRWPSNGAVLLWLVGLTVLILALDVLTGAGVRLGGLLAFLPAFAAAFCTVPQTTFTACWATATVALSLIYQPHHRSDAAVAVLVTAVFGVLSVLGCRYRIRHENELLRLRSTATAMQRSILRPLPLLTGQVLMDGVYEPLQEDKLVGGDIYDLAASPYGTRVLIGDVQGKGLAAIGVAFAVIGSFREAAHREATLTGLVEALEDAVVRHNAVAAETDEPERFVTALVLGIDTTPGVEVVNCGHPRPCLIGPGMPLSVPLGDADLPLGLHSLAPGPRSVDRFDFPAGTTLLLCTDGLTEARSPDGALFPLEERLAAGARPTAAGRLAQSPHDLAQSLYDESRGFAAGLQQDDIAILTLRRTDPAGPRDAVRSARGISRRSPDPSP